MSTRNVGAHAENIAGNFLVGRGYTILARNIHLRFTEIDILAGIGQTLVLVEVKYRSSNRQGLPEDAITPLKKMRLMRASYLLLYRYHSFGYTSCRIDVITISQGSIRHIISAV